MATSPSHSSCTARDAERWTAQDQLVSLEPVSVDYTCLKREEICHVVRYCVQSQSQHCGCTQVPQLLCTYFIATSLFATNPPQSTDTWSLPFIVTLVRSFFRS